MNKPRILRKRYLPLETVDISGDELLYRDDQVLITKWKPIRPRTDFAGGISFTFLKEGYKISRFYHSDLSFLYWYCDIIDVEYDGAQDQYTLKDLLVDVKILPDGRFMILDAGELAQTLEEGTITQKQVCIALKNLDKILTMLQEEKFPPEICKNYNYSEIVNG